MQTPIDFKSLYFPIKEKYLDEETPEFAYWIIFGERADGTVDIDDGYQGKTIFTNVPKDKAARLISIRDQYVRDIVAEINS